MNSWIRTLGGPRLHCKYCTGSIKRRRATDHRTAAIMTGSGNCDRVVACRTQNRRRRHGQTCLPPKTHNKTSERRGDCFNCPLHHRHDHPQPQTWGPCTAINYCGPQDFHWEDTSDFGQIKTADRPGLHKLEPRCSQGQVKDCVHAFWLKASCKKSRQVATFGGPTRALYVGGSWWFDVLTEDCRAALPHDTMAPIRSAVVLRCRHGRCSPFKRGKCHQYSIRLVSPRLFFAPLKTRPHSHSLT